jgi:IS605 OrfB family transposase
LELLQTYQTKLSNVQLDHHLDSYRYLDEFSKFFGFLERKLFVLFYVKKQSFSSVKPLFCKQYGITSRQFNALRMQLEGKVSAVKEVRKYQIEQLKHRIMELERIIEKKTKQKEKQHTKLMELKEIDVCFRKTVKRYRNIKFVLHQKKRKLRNLKQKLEQLQQDERNNIIRICFGSKRLFHKQFHLDKNGYSSHEEWKRDWQRARSSQFVVIGSKDETFGNQSAIYNTKNELHLRVANQLVDTYGKYIVFPNVLFPYGQEVLNQAKIAYMGFTKGGKPKKYFRAITYRFLRKEKGWYLFATVERDVPEISTTDLGGYIGIDLNAGFLSVCEVDRFGNPLQEQKIRISMYDRNKNQIFASLSNAIQQVMKYALSVGKHVAIEDLHFFKKKAVLGEMNPKYARMLSGFAYSKFKSLVESKAKKLGVGIRFVRPYYTSQIGHMKFMARYGLSPHGSAACVIARRALRFSLEKPKYDTVLQLPKTLDKHQSNYSKWRSITNSEKKNYWFHDKIEILKADI